MPLSGQSKAMEAEGDEGDNDSEWDNRSGHSPLLEIPGDDNLEPVLSLANDRFVQKVSGRRFSGGSALEAPEEDETKGNDDQKEPEYLYTHSSTAQSQVSRAVNLQRGPGSKTAIQKIRDSVRESRRIRIRDTPFRNNPSPIVSTRNIDKKSKLTAVRAARTQRLRSLVHGKNSDTTSTQIVSEGQTSLIKSIAWKTRQSNSAIDDTLG
ncbi:MAG: hypothetical protein M1814_005620 [Vezdaea aestivalis]|nr:MAG: hypothetical protein M1814_005620 [Vezdaea aestivalis]